jgi:hypothetical protein
MIKKRFNVPIYCYDCVFLEIESRDDAEALTKELKRLRITDEIMEEVSTSCVDDKEAAAYLDGYVSRYLR